MTMEQAAPATPSTAGVGQSDEQLASRMANFLEQHDREANAPEQAEPAPTEPPQTQPATEAEQAKPSGDPEQPTPDDIPDEAPQEALGDVPLTIIHNGTEVKLSREEAIKYAQQGLDYDRKASALAEQRRRTDAGLQALQQAEQVQAQLLGEIAQVKALEAQAAQYNGVDWVQLASTDTTEYARHRAQFDQLNHALNQARWTLQQKAAAVDAQVSQVKAMRLQEEAEKLPQFIPEWKDAAKADAGKAQLVKYLVGLGADPKELGGRLTDAFSVSVAWKAMKYDALVSAKNDKVKQLRTAPPVTKPGAAQTPAQIGADQRAKLQDKLKRSGDVRDAAALLLTRLK